MCEQNAKNLSSNTTVGQARSPAPTFNELPQKFSPAAASNLFSQYTLEADAPHFVPSYEFWEIFGMLEDEKSHKFSFATTFTRTGAFWLPVHFVTTSLLDWNKNEFKYKTYGYKLLTNAALREIRRRSQAFPDNLMYKTMVENFENRNFKNFTIISKPCKIPPKVLSLKFGPNYLLRLSKDFPLYYTNLFLDKDNLSLSFRPVTVEKMIAYLDKDIIKIDDNSFMEGYSLPNIYFSGTLTNNTDKSFLNGMGWFNHYWAEWGPTTFSEYAWFFLTFDDGSVLQMFNFFDKEGNLKTSKLIFLDSKNEKIENSKPEIEIQSHNVVRGFSPVNPREQYTSAPFNIRYQSNWRLKTDKLLINISRSKDVEKESSLIDGMGSFWLGACKAEGTIANNKTTKKIHGAGYCKIIGQEMP